MKKTVTQSVPAMPKPSAGEQQFVLKLRQILATAILEFTAFGPQEQRCAPPSATDKSPTRLQKQSAAFLALLFLREGQPSSFHALMASSFLWVASSTGFCTLGLVARRRRLQWAG